MQKKKSTLIRLDQPKHSNADGVVKSESKGGDGTPRVSNCVMWEKILPGKDMWLFKPSLLFRVATDIRKKDIWFPGGKQKGAANSFRPLEAQGSNGSPTLRAGEKAGREGKGNVEGGGDQSHGELVEDWIVGKVVGGSAKGAVVWAQGANPR